jgi:hypothetical protein
MLITLQLHASTSDQWAKQANRRDTPGHKLFTHQMLNIKDFYYVQTYKHIIEVASNIQNNNSPI